MDESQRLEQARDLIISKRYEEARAVLQPIADNPTARTWLAKLDEIAPVDLFPLPNPFDDDLPAPDLESAWGPSAAPPNTTGIPPYSSPWNPQYLTVLIFFFSPGALAVFSLNWRRLGRPKWALPNFLIGLVLIMIPIGFLLTAATFDINVKGQYWIFIPLLGGYVAYYVFLFGLYFYQNREYKRYLVYGDVGGKGKYRSDYFWLGGAAVVLIGGLALAVMLISSTVTQPKKIETPYLTLERPYDWSGDGQSWAGDCGDYRQGCFLYINYHGLEVKDMMFVYIPLNGRSYQAVVNNLWFNYQTYYPSAVFGPQTTVMIDGVAITFQEYAPPTYHYSNGDSVSSYAARGYVVLGDGLIEITFSSSSEAEFRRLYRKFTDILDTVHFKNTVATPIA